METNDFFVDDEEEPIEEPKTTMFDNNDTEEFEEPKTTIFSKDDRTSQSNKPSYEFSSPTEPIITPKPTSSHENVPPVQKEVESKPFQKRTPIINPHSIRNKSKGFITGILVSFSKDPKGEFWIVRQGKNTIGSDRSNDIVLNEANISDQHAALNVRRSRKDNRLMFAVVDMCSEVGTLVNGEDIEFTTTELNMGDKLVVGGYELLLLSFDKDKQGLTTNSAFEELIKSTPSNSKQGNWQPNMDYAAGNPLDRDGATQISS